jgi:1,4-alpha-glucan branching enzyme
MVDDNEDLIRRWLKLADRTRDPRQVDLATQALLALSSDWAFMVSKDSAADYARERHVGHHTAFERMAHAIETDRPLAADPPNGPSRIIEPRLL